MSAPQCAIGVGDLAEQGAVKAVVAAMVGEELVHVAVGRAHLRAQLRLDRRRVELAHLLVARRAQAQIIDRAALAEAPAQCLDVADQRFIAAAFRIGHELGQSAVDELVGRAPLDRLEPRRDAGFGRESGEQRLGEGVDGLDADSARRIEHPGEQLPRAFAGFRAAAFAKRLELRAELGIAQPHPARQPLPDAFGHGRSAGLGEGQAQDGLGRRAIEQQPEHAAGEDMGLAGPGRGRQRGIGEGIGGEPLLYPQPRRRHSSPGHQPRPSQAQPQPIETGFRAAGN